MSKSRKVRAQFRKNRTPRSRTADLTREFADRSVEQGDRERGERISGRGALARKRTVRGTPVDPETSGGMGMVLDVDEQCLPGRVLAVHGLTSTVEGPDGRRIQCATRRLLKTIETDQRHVVAAGDRVLFRPANLEEGIIERVEARTGVLTRASRGRRQVIVANVDQLLIVASAAEPYLKPNLIDRFLVASEQGRIEPAIVINKVDLVEPAELQPIVGVYSQLGYRALLVSARTGLGIERLRRTLAGRQSVIAGQSGVGKSSLLNAVDPGLELAVSDVSAGSQKGRHTTTTARLLPLSGGGYVVDTPGIRQFELWDIVPAEVANYFRDLRPFQSRCGFPDCTHTHEDDCAVKDAVADDLIDARRYESYEHLFRGELE